ncbi:MAG TPA: aldose epimerase family protein [Polyangia bacterium]|nr:aldose epimerase family protein [Polyangia bacterium]
MTIDPARAEVAPTIDPVDIYTLQQPGGLRARILTLGGAVMTLEVPDREGRLVDVVLGFDDASGYQDNRPFLGALIGRYGNRIARGALRVDGRLYQLAANDGPNHLHGGPGGFHTLPWEVRAVSDGPEPTLALRLVSRDGDEGYPGTLQVDVVYTLTREHALRIDYTARTDRPTVANLTQHSYFNLGGHAAGSILGHELRLWASRFIPIDNQGIPTGGPRPVRGTPFDFLAPLPIGARIEADDEQLQSGVGYDHCFAVDGWDGSLRAVAEVVEPVSGRRMLVRSTEPGLQLYVGTHLGGIAGKRGARYATRTGFCLEAQHFPDSPNRPEFPSTRLAPGETYRQTTEYVFSNE